MSFYQKDIKKGAEYRPGFFLAHEECTRKTYQFKADDTSVKTTETGGKYVPAGTVVLDGENVKGIAYEDVDVTYGDMPGSLVTAGTVYLDLLPSGTDKAKLTAAGFTVIDKAPVVERPADFDIADIELPKVEEATANTAGAKSAPKAAK